ncbi:hypothetical protein VTN31DRAFT_2976 [Thermomyces dupontii]|uniref:uncharacterized protein n=1 Tax=Talaromyces thermophilus TaxID=28565 RepID=UPI003742E632
MPCLVFCCCFKPPRCHRNKACPEQTQPPVNNHDQWYRPRLSTTSSSRWSLGEPPRYESLDDTGYTPVVPLPRYTPRPASIYEKTLHTSAHHGPSNPDGKDRSLFAEQQPRCHSTEATMAPTKTGMSSTTTTTMMDDASSAYSFPSSFGQTSTATRDTPPPPYASCASLPLVRSRTSSVRTVPSCSSPREERTPSITAEGSPTPSPSPPSPMAMETVQRPQPVYRRRESDGGGGSGSPVRDYASRESGQGMRRQSWGSR